MEKNRIIMDSGKEYIVSLDKNTIINMYTTQIGIMINGLRQLGNDILINPAHISSIETISK